ncbi:unnamed protein product [Aspergillus niger]|uniref:Contig An06c0050, genomic contig n=1 Tax=Aspergillus niger (strain ATCC MYA-4892 / CBS 513.88 / FGSC A1513) TaxID=425011 RepID=A2QLF2_ASPNC|nr:unnamed protein product [Aspergillus niger]
MTILNDGQNEDIYRKDRE